MFDNSFFNWGGNSKLTDTKYVIQEFKHTTNFIQENWKDDLGTKFVRLLQNVEMELTKLEHRKVALTESVSALKEKLHEIANDDDSEHVLVKKKTLSPSGGNSQSSSGGFSRVKNGKY